MQTSIASNTNSIQNGSINNTSKIDTSTIGSKSKDNTRIIIINIIVGWESVFLNYFISILITLFLLLVVLASWY